MCITVADRLMEYRQITRNRAPARQPPDMIASNAGGTLRCNGVQENCNFYVFLNIGPWIVA
jgi:hypothetical protein